jgi:4-oxalocrotonate tautomerase
VVVQIIEGRTRDQKQAIARDIIKSLVTHAGAREQDCTIIFQDVAATDWIIAGETVAERRRKRGENGH